MTTSTTCCPICRIEVEVLDITHHTFCYGCQDTADVLVLKCGNTHGMCKDCTTNFNSAIDDRPIDQENEYLEAAINEENRIQEEMIRDEAIKKKIVELRIKLKQKRDDRIKSYMMYQKISYNYIKKENKELIDTYDSVIKVIIKDRDEYNKIEKTEFDKLKIYEEQMYKNTNYVYTKVLKLLVKDRANHGKLIRTNLERNVCDAAYDAEQSIMYLITLKNIAYNDYSNSSTIEELRLKKEKYYENIKANIAELCIFKLICAKNAMNNDKLNSFREGTMKVVKNIDEQLIKENKIIIKMYHIHLKEKQQRKIYEALLREQKANHEQAAIIAARMNDTFHN
jgi:hypothetical protein